MVVLGGTGRLYGALVGTAVFMIAQDYLAGINPVYWQFWLGLGLVVFVFVARALPPPWGRAGEGDRHR
jgi:branched-chain amino acid transport system permease protein